MVPSVLLAAILALAGGVSLGPENPITAANIALACAVGIRVAGRETQPLWLALAAAGTIGALFGTPVAAALILSEMAMGPAAMPLWDRLFAPLIAAGAGALTTQALASPSFTVDVPPYGTFHLVDLVSACLMALAGGLIGLAIVYPFKMVHALFRKFRNPIVMLTVSGLILGILGAIGGMITLFKGLSQMRELVNTVSAYSTWGLVLVIAVKAAALLLAAASEFRGGRIFPTVFIGVAVGLLGNRLFPSIPESLAIGAALLGIVVAITQQGWLSLFLAGTVTMDIKLFPILCIAILPVWLLMINKPEMVLPHDEASPVPAH
jgi:H+/Cl- antiporter ClcA